MEWIMTTAGVSHTTIKPQWLVLILVLKCEFYIWMYLKSLFTRHSYSFSLSDFHAAQDNDHSLACWTIERLSHYISWHIHDCSVLANFVTLCWNFSYTWRCSCNSQCTEIFIFVALLYFWSNVLSITDRIQKFRNDNEQPYIKNCSIARSGAEDRCNVWGLTANRRI
jgi:hypothetical protein